VRVLVVEDEEAPAEIFHDFLMALGHQPIVVHTAEAGLRELRSARPDAVLLDIHLPGMSGLDFLRLVQTSRIPVVAISGVVTEDQARECLRLGAIDFVQKPVPFEHLKEILACLEPFVDDEEPADAEHREIRPRASRTAIVVPVRVREYNGVEWDSVSLNVSASGMKIRRGATRPGPAVRLAFTPPDGQEGLEVLSLLVRADLDGYAFYFVNLSSAHFERLNRLVERLKAAHAARPPR